MSQGDKVAYVVDGQTVFTGRLVYLRGRWAGISTRDGRHVDEVLVTHIQPVSF